MKQTPVQLVAIVSTFLTATHKVKIEKKKRSILT